MLDLAAGAVDREVPQGDDVEALPAPVGVREALAAHKILSYRVVWFEDRPPEEYDSLEGEPFWKR